MLEYLPGIRPEVFFEISSDILYAKKFPLTSKHLLPDTSELLLEEPLDVSMAWNEKGLLFHLDENSFIESFFPDFRNGDSIELFIDTRPKTSQVVSKFCHHFVFLPKKVGDIQAKEVTKFRSSDLRDHFELGNVISVTNKGIDIMVPAECLLGYDTAGDKLGFNYRINRFKGKPKHLFFASESCNIEKHPNIWGTFNLVR